MTITAAVVLKDQSSYLVDLNSPLAPICLTTSALPYSFLNKISTLSDVIALLSGTIFDKTQQKPFKVQQFSGPLHIIVPKKKKGNCAPASNSCIKSINIR